MVYAGYFICLFTFIQLIVVIVNFLLKQRLQKSKIQYSDLVSVLIPARNEEKNIGLLLDNLLNQSYNNIEIIVFNDMSTDNTAGVVLEKSISDKRIRIINSRVLPAGWLGKNYACHKLSVCARGKYLLFLDADVNIYNCCINNTIYMAEKYNLGLLSIFPKQKMVSLGERITVPVMNYILLSLLPLILVRITRYKSLSAANGQFMFFNSETYRKTIPHFKMKNKKVEDIEIARYFKSIGIKIACLTGDESITCRMYNCFKQAVNGFSKNVVMFFGNSFITAVIFWIVSTFGVMMVIFGLSFGFLYSYIIIILIIRILISIISKQNILVNIFLIIPQQIALGLFIYKAMISKQKNQYQWKNRNIL